MDNTQLKFDFVHCTYDPDHMRIQSGRLYFGHKLLVDAHHVPADSLKVRRSEYKKGVSKNYKFEIFFCTDGTPTFFYDAETLPKALFEKYNLPSLEEAAKQFSPRFQLMLKMKTDVLPPTNSELVQLINNAVDHAFRHEYLFYRSEHFAPVSKRLSQKFAVLDLLRGYLEERPKETTIKALREILTRPMFNDLGFPKEASAFYSYLSRAREAKDLKKFTLGRLNVNENAKKLNDVVVELICLFGGHGNPIPAEKVLILVNTMLLVFPKFNGKKLLNIRTVQTQLKKHKTKIKIYKEGEDFVRKRLSAYLHMSEAQNPFDQFSMDEWWLEFACRSSDKRLRKIVLGLMDGRSKKMVNHWIVKGLNKEVIKGFLYETHELCRDRMCAEFVCDFASYNVSGDISRMLNYLVYKHRNGEKKFAWTVSSNANRKDIERFWETYGSYYLSPHIGATGQGITAKRENSCPAKIIEILIEDPAFLDDEVELDRLIHHFFDQYCKKGIHTDLDSPNEIFRDNKAVNAITLEPVDIAFMYGKKDSRKYDRSEVRLNGRDYQTFNNKISELCHDKMVDIYYHDRFPDSVFVFLKDSMDFVGELNFYNCNPKAIVNQTPEQKAALGVLCDKQETMVLNSLRLKPQGIEMIKEVTDGVDPCDVGMGLIDLLLPPKTSSVLHLNPAAMEKIEVNPFDPKLKKDYQKAGKRKPKKTPIPSKGLMSDSLSRSVG